MKNIFNYNFIGFIQGITEFLPISSSGHIVLFGHLLGLEDVLLVSVAAHLGTLLAVIFWYRRRIGYMIKRPFNPTNINLVLATIPSVIAVLVFHNAIEESFSVYSLVWGFLLSSILLLIASLIKQKNRPLTRPKAIFMGLGQSLALLPGISRSGTTL